MRIILFLTAMLFLGCKKEQPKEPLYPLPEEQKSPVLQGQEIFEGKGNCFACHKPDQKIIGPSIAEIAQVYKEKNGNLVRFLTEKSGPLVDPTQYTVMKTNFTITKGMTNQELKAIEAYINSFRK